MFSLHEHPVWILLSKWRLPYEIINIIFSFKTFSFASFFLHL